MDQLVVAVKPVSHRFPTTQGGRPMIIDADRHISSHRFDSLAMTADVLIEGMDRAGVDRALGTDRLCFGSDSPFRLMHVQLAMYRALLRDFSEGDRAKVLGGTLARLLGI
jgi:predicted TIM-barrel fold metal-dependent hydrolase